MRAILQRVTSARISLNTQPGKTIESIGNGLLILAGFAPDDTPVILEQMAQKIRSLRIFPDAAGKMNLSPTEAGAQYLLVSQFTLYADCRYGNRPSFAAAAEKARAKEYYEHFVKAFERVAGADAVKHGEFGSDLLVELVNNGPVTLALDSRDLL